jgi:hypothetical protein
MPKLMHCVVCAKLLINRPERFAHSRKGMAITCKSDKCRKTLGHVRQAYAARKQGSQNAWIRARLRAMLIQGAPRAVWAVTRPGDRNTPWVLAQWDGYQEQAQ